MRKEESKVKSQKSKIFFVILFFIALFYLLGSFTKVEAEVTISCSSCSNGFGGCNNWTTCYKVGNGCVKSHFCKCMLPNNGGLGNTSCSEFTYCPASSCAPTSPPSSGGSGNNNPSTPTPAATGTPGATNPSTRLASSEGTEELCKTLTVSANTLSSGGNITLTASAKDATDVKTFTYKFFNVENPKANKAIMFTANTPYEITYTSNNLSAINSTTVNFTDMDKSDLNYDFYANRPKKIVVEAYFTKADAKWSKFNSACRAEFTVNSIDPTPTINLNCKCTNNTCTTDCLVDKYDGINYTTPLKCNVDTTIYSTTGTVPWCGYYKRAKGDANGDGKTDSLDYFYYLSVKAGAKLPLSVNVDFNGDSYVGSDDRAILIKSLK